MTEHFCCASVITTCSQTNLISICCYIMTAGYVQSRCAFCQQKLYQHSYPTIFKIYYIQQLTLLNFCCISAVTSYTVMHIVLNKFVSTLAENNISYQNINILPTKCEAYKLYRTCSVQSTFIIWVMYLPMKCMHILYCYT